MLKKIDGIGLLITLILIIGLMDSRDKGFETFILYVFTAFGIYLVLELRRYEKEKKKNK